MDNSTLNNSFFNSSFVDNVMQDNSCGDSINRNVQDSHLNVNNQIPSPQTNTGSSDGRSHHDMSLVQQTNEQHTPQRSDCMHQARTAAPQAGYSGMSRSTHTVTGNSDYPGFHRSTTQNGYQRQSEAPTTFSQVNYSSQEQQRVVHQFGHVANTRSVLDNGQHQPYFIAGQLPDHTNVGHWQFQDSGPTQTSTPGFLDGYPPATVISPPTHRNNQVSAPENYTHYEALSMACDSNIPVGQFMPCNYQNAIPLPMASCSNHGTNNATASTSGMQMDQYMPWSSDSSNVMTQLMPHTNWAMMQPELSTAWNQTENPVPCNPGTVVPQSIQAGSSAVTKTDEKKPSASCLQLIADALLASEHGRLVLGDICKAIMDKYTYYQNSKTKWRGGIRHSLSVNNCFYMVTASNLGKGNLWAIHHSCLEYFRNGKYNRRAANQIVQHWHNQNGPKNTTANEPSSSQQTIEDPSAATDGSNPSSPSTVAASSAQQQDAPDTQD